VLAVIADLAPFELNWIVDCPNVSPETDTPPADEIADRAFSADEIAPAVAEKLNAPLVSAEYDRVKVPSEGVAVRFPIAKFTDDAD
jgi:hypothetical protein